MRVVMRSRVAGHVPRYDPPCVRALTLSGAGVWLAPDDLTQERMTEPAEPTDTIFQLLAHEHRDLEARFAALHEMVATDVEDARSHYPELAHAILAHLRAEAAVLLPRLEGIPTLEDVLARSRIDHARIEADARALAQQNLTSSEWVRGVRRLAAELEQLIEREEAHVFPVARRELAPDESHRLAVALHG